MPRDLPMFPLNAVAFPGATVRLNVFEDRYRALVEHVLSQPKPERLFGITAIREGYEVGAHGVQSLHTTGTLMQLVEASRTHDGRFEIEAVGRQRLSLLRMHPAGDFPVGEVELLDEPMGENVGKAMLSAMNAFGHYREQIEDLVDLDFSDDWPDDPEWLSWSMAADVMLTMAQRQELLLCTTSADRLRHLAQYLREETRAMQALPSLPATDLARTRWSPN
ncbi:MAG: LON peptidase substrate-binding domain-containing protein [Marmoricola sp.]